MPRRLIALVAFHVVLAPVVLLVAGRMVPLELENLPLIWAAISVTFGQFGLLAFWLGMGTNRLVFRLVAAGAAAAYLLALLNAFDSELDVARIATFNFWYNLCVRWLLTMLVLGTFALGLASLRRWVSRIERLTNLDQLRRAKPQFTLFQILLLTTVVAVLLALRRGARGEESPEGFRAVVGFVFFFAVCAVNLCCALWASLGSGNTWLRSALVLMTAAALGLYVAVPAMQPSFGWWLYVSQSVITLVPTAVVVLSLLVVRSCGYRLVPVGFRPDDVGDSTKST